MKYAQWIITFANGFKISETIVTSWIIMLGLIIAAFILTRDLKPVPTTKRQIMLEYAVSTLRDLVRSNMGENVEKKMPNMLPYIGSLVFILRMFKLDRIIRFQISNNRC